jgi:hypothetical protein
MKKIISLIILFLLFGLSSCQIAQVNPNETTNIEDSQGTYVPVRLDFNILTHQGEIYDDELLYWSWFCNSDNPNFSCSSNKYGEGFEINSQSMNIDINEVDFNGDVSTTTTTTFDADLSVYFGSDISEYYIISPTLHLIDLDTGTKKEEMLTNFSLQEGVAISITSEYPISENEMMIITFKVNFVLIDELQNVIIREYDYSNNLVKITSFTEGNLVDEFETDSQTAYIIFEEEYKNSLEEVYYVRTLYSESKFINVKFLDDDNFVHIRNIHLILGD